MMCGCNQTIDCDCPQGDSVDEVIVATPLEMKPRHTYELLACGDKNKNIFCPPRNCCHHVNMYACGPLYLKVCKSLCQGKPELLLTRLKKTVSLSPSEEHDKAYIYCFMEGLQPGWFKPQLKFKSGLRIDLEEVFFLPCPEDELEETQCLETKCEEAGC